MIEIKITDPHLVSKEILRKTAAYLLDLAADQLVAEHNMPISPVVVPPPPSFYVPDFNTAPIAMHLSAGTGIMSEDDDAVPELMNPTNLPWDARIHARTKTKNSDGSYKLKRGIDEKTVRTVTEELQKVLQIPSAGVPERHWPAMSSSAAPAAPVTIGSSVHEMVPPPPKSIGFPEVMAWIAESVNAGVITSAKVIELIKPLGFESVPLLSHRPDLMPLVLQRLEQFVTHGV